MEEVRLKLAEYNMENTINNTGEYIEDVLEGFDYIKSGSDEDGYYDIFEYKERKIKVYYDNDNNVSNVELAENISDDIVYKKLAGPYGVATNGLLYDLNQSTCLNDEESESLYGAFLMDIAYGTSDTPICISDISGNPLNGVKIVSISTSYKTMTAIDKNGKVWTWGDNTYGQLADGSFESSSVPFCVNDDLDYLDGVQFASVSAGTGHVVAVDTNGKIWTWGKNDYGQLGNNTQANLTAPVCINDLDENPLNDVQIAKAVAGRYTSAAIDESGNLWIWGRYTGSDSWGGTNTPQPVPECLNNVDDGIEFSDLITRSDVLVLADTNKNLYGCMILNWNYVWSDLVVMDQYTSLYPQKTINQATVLDGKVELLGDSFVIDVDGNIHPIEISLAQ